MPGLLAQSWAAWMQRPSPLRFAARSIGVHSRRRRRRGVL